MSTKNNIIINEGIHAKEAQFCLLCGNEGRLLYQDLRDRLFNVPGIWVLLNCQKCHLIWLHPCPIPQEIGKLYSEYFTHDIKVESSEKGTGLLRTLRKINHALPRYAFDYRNKGGTFKTLRILVWLASRFGPLRDIVEGSMMWLNRSRPGKLLDIGCGNGQFLSRMQGFGWQVFGVEPDGQAAKIAREKFGISIYEGTLEEVDFHDDTFDTITMSHVIEHLPDPINTLRECYRVLKPGGQLVITTPNIKSLGHRLFRESWRGFEVPRHLFLFSLYSLRTCAERLGFKVLKLRTSARIAPYIWVTSQLIRQDGILPDESKKMQSFWLWLEGMVFQLVEHGICWFRDVGEEVVMIANKEKVE